MSNEQLLIMEAALGGLDVSEELDFKSATSCVQHMGKLFLDIFVAKGIGTIVDNDVAWAIDIDILEERIIGTSNVLFLEKIFEFVMEDDDLISELLEDCEEGINICQQIYVYQDKDIDDYCVHRLLKYVTNALVTLGKLDTVGRANTVVSSMPQSVVTQEDASRLVKLFMEDDTLPTLSFDQQVDGSKALSTLLFTDPAIVQYRVTLEGIRGEDLANNLGCGTWDFLDGINLAWAIRNKPWFLPYFKQRRVMFCNAMMGIYGSGVNCGQLFKGTPTAIQMAFGTKKCIDYQGSILSDKMDEGNQSVLYLMTDMIYEAFREGGTSSEEWTREAAFKVAQSYITFFDWSLLCCEGNENDVNGTEWKSMKTQLKKRGGLMLWRMFAVINLGWYAIEYHIESEGGQLQLLEASSRTMKLSHGRTTDEVLSNNLIQIFPLCHANALELYLTTRHIFSYERLLKLDENLVRYLQPLVGTTIPGGNDTLVLRLDDFNYCIKRAKLAGLTLEQIEEVYEVAEKLRAEKKRVKLAVEAEMQSSVQAVVNGEETIRDLALILVKENKLIEACMNKEKIKNEALERERKLKEREKKFEEKMERKEMELKERMRMFKEKMERKFEEKMERKEMELKEREMELKERERLAPPMLALREAAGGSPVPPPKSASEVTFDITNPPDKSVIPPSTMPVIDSLTQMTENDVLCGRGGGTRHYRALVRDFQPTYLIALKRDKPLLARSVVLIIRNRGGRFLRRDEKDGRLYEIGDEEAEAKTGQALREGLDVRATKRATNTLTGRDGTKKRKNTSSSVEGPSSKKMANLEHGPSWEVDRRQRGSVDQHYGGGHQHHPGYHHQAGPPVHQLYRGAPPPPQFTRGHPMPGENMAMGQQGSTKVPPPHFAPPPIVHQPQSNIPVSHSGGQPQPNKSNQRIPSDTEIRLEMQSLMERVDLETTSINKFITILSEKFAGADLSSKRTFIKEFCDLFLYESDDE